MRLTFRVRALVIDSVDENLGGWRDSRERVRRHRKAPQAPAEAERFFLYNGCQRSPHDV